MRRLGSGKIGKFVKKYKKSLITLLVVLIIDHYSPNTITKGVTYIPAALQRGSDWLFLAFHEISHLATAAFHWASNEVSHLMGH